MGLMNAVDGMPMEMVGFMTGPLGQEAEGAGEGLERPRSLLFLWIRWPVAS